jgi:hypothetical protein
VYIGKIVIRFMILCLYGKKQATGIEENKAAHSQFPGSESSRRAGKKVQSISEANSLAG